MIDIGSPVAITIQKKRRVTSANIQSLYDDDLQRLIVNIEAHYEYVYINTSTNAQARPPEFAGSAVIQDALQGGDANLVSALNYIETKLQDAFTA